MFRLLLGFLLVALVTAAVMRRPALPKGVAWPTGRVDEFSSAADNVVADPAVNAGDGTPSHITASDV